MNRLAVSLWLSFIRAVFPCKPAAAFAPRAREKTIGFVKKPSDARSLRALAMTDGTTAPTGASYARVESYTN
jgi:hypothetical protein